MTNSNGAQKCFRDLVVIILREKLGKTIVPGRRPSEVGKEELAT